MMLVHREPAAWERGRGKINASQQTRLGRLGLGWPVVAKWLNEPVQKVHTARVRTEWDGGKRAQSRN